MGHCQTVTGGVRRGGGVVRSKVGFDEKSRMARVARRAAYGESLEWRGFELPRSLLAAAVGLMRERVRGTTMYVPEGTTRGDYQTGIALLARRRSLRRVKERYKTQHPPGRVG